MIRGSIALAAAGLALALTPGIASADPSDSTATTPTCTFAVSAPQAATLPGPGNATGVTATLTWTGCTGLASPIQGTACLSTPSSNGRCVLAHGWNPSLAIFPTQNPTGVFTVRGRGCYRVVSQPTLICDTAEQTVTL